MFDLPNISSEVETLEKLKDKYNTLSQQEIDYSSPDAKKHYQTLNKIEKFVHQLSEIKRIHDELIGLRQIIEEDSDLEEEAMKEYEILYPELIDKITSLYDTIAESNQQIYNEIIMEIRAGTGGDEASLFAKDLLRMYTRYVDNNGWQMEIVDMSQNELKGIKSCSVSITGENIYKFFQFESGVHRVQRLPVTESNGRIHTSTASVSIMPCEENLNIDIDPKDVLIDTYRAGGAGGQHVNKTDSAVRLHHQPTGIIVQCQDERSQIKNKEKAFKILAVKLQQISIEKQMEDRNKIRGQQIGSNERSDKSRTYNYPQNRITDHKYEVTLYQLDHIIEGNLEILTDKIFKEFQKQELKNHSKLELIQSLL